MLQLRLDMLVDQYDKIKLSNVPNKELKLKKLETWIDQVHEKIVMQDLGEQLIRDMDNQAFV